MIRRLAIALFLLSSLAMGMLGWMLGRPGVLRPERQVSAAGSDPRAAPASSSSSGAGGSHTAFDSEHASSEGD
jgi:hypothetical protein